MISTEQLDGLWREGLRQGKQTGLTVASGSMAPLIRTGDRIIVRPYAEGERVSLGDIVLFDVDGQWLVHRVIGRNEQRGGTVYRQKGDASYNAVSSPGSSVAGRVVRIEKGDGSVIDLGGRHRMVNGFLGRFFYALDLLRRLGERRDGGMAATGEASAARLAAARLLRWLESLAARTGAYIMKKQRG